ncbi:MULTISPECIES: tryptophan-rich sensory protein [Paraburkholderia]|uniref:Tryptophan-rich sensory protein n=1 Tax=Paraburkholderia madseniana TaxID=2599607 RepID=A0AAP5B877_9BURK|nr:MULTISPECIES: tryptophan-rich sensory protein [Paraburkholderia]MCX4143926.1 tryptophan-rich sensory protein [Paraburkholderia madseniana]MDN7146880.1 tryptophan-rich sensory protein [Paraburkholderia sp. WS6]MDQ6405760.1 tryptophan-rich sensory protein [Paraburkholderia madseniana]
MIRNVWRRLKDAPFAVVVRVLLLIVALTLALWRRDHWAGELLEPHVAWVAFTAVLDHALWQLNPAV